ncbi:neuroepithelial cell-transforming gene 1 protein-like [Hippocampus zosterae]|uniref:neuroepithelial cell-transforming gene 1 protein-like n=1 Tax=Hippocampus zosterae TaxID=109293 RepID=UPI00223D7058|nr:neuroepithelial cell-transforming gene 1 protein-like [Hippocampus zosterae]XP_051917893.1 neuroepithelial cell-transforming gene 1 protein-like [Hippocampus zosterae]
MDESEEAAAMGKKQKLRRTSSRLSTASVSSFAEPSPRTLRRNNSKKPPLQRGSSFTFLTPGTPWDFSLKRKRKEKEDDTVSLSSFDIKEPTHKKGRPLARVSSLVNFISPSKNAAVRRFGQTIQSMSLRGDGKSPGTSLHGGKMAAAAAAAPTPTKRRGGVLWSETLDVHQKSAFSSKEIKRQEAIYELFRGEQDLIEDLQLARKAYHDPMLKLSIMTEEELAHIFGDLDAYIPLHQDLLTKLTDGTSADGTVPQIGQIVIDWLPGLNAYRNYCSNQLAAKALLDQKKQDRRVQDFLQRCLESPFSRKLDLWSFLDIPRSRLVKYPLLLREIMRHTPAEHPDVAHLERAVAIIQEILSDINVRKGERECRYYADKLEYLDDKQRHPLIDSCTSLLCHGELRNKSGSRLHVFLFSELLVLTRPVTRNERGCFQVYRRPIPVRDLALEDLQDGEVRLGGSFRGAFANADKAKNVFRVSSSDPSHGQSHTLHVDDVYRKQQWLNCLRGAMASHGAPTTRAKRRSSAVYDGNENCPPAGPRLRPQRSRTSVHRKETGV